MNFGRVGESEQGVRQGCLVSPHLFNILLADLEEEMRKEEEGGVKLKGRKVFSLAYADDVVLMAEEKEGMKAIMFELERYLERKGLTQS